MMIGRKVRSMAIVAVLTLVALSIAGTALASQYGYGNPGPFPDTCDITGLSWAQQESTNSVAAWTTEQSACARLQAKIRYRATSGSWVTADTGWKFASQVTTGYRDAYQYSNPDWSDHNGDNNGSGTSYGFRIDW